MLKLVVQVRVFGGIRQQVLKLHFAALTFQPRSFVVDPLRWKNFCVRMMRPLVSITTQLPPDWGSDEPEGSMVPVWESGGLQG